jgi:sugar diacid utilization regulator/putative methionine-R-sulfoxide reductase with GAF domain
VSLSVENAHLFLTGRELDANGRELSTRREHRVLHEIISSVASSLDLGDVLSAVVRLLSDASSVRDCFVYLSEADGERLVLYAASTGYEDSVGSLAFERGEGLVWFAAEEGGPLFISENAMSHPRAKSVPALDAQPYQSQVVVPIVAKSKRLAGVISLHSTTRREFTPQEAAFLVTAASLVAGAIENARLHEETQCRLGELEKLTAFAESVAAARDMDELAVDVVARTRSLLAADSCHLYLLSRHSEDLRLRASCPSDSPAAACVRLSELGSDLSSRRGRSVLPLIAGEELVGMLSVDGASSVDLGRAVASQTAVAMKKIESLEQLADKCTTKDFFDELEAGHTESELRKKASRLGFYFEESYAVLSASPPDEHLEHIISSVARSSLVDRREHLVRALVRVPAAGPAALFSDLRAGLDELRGRVAVGISNPCRGAASFVAGFQESQDALSASGLLHASPRTVLYQELGAYKYLLHVPIAQTLRDLHRAAIERVADYDAKHATTLLMTLEEFLGQRGNFRTTAEALYVHRNTLRQRVKRIEEVSGLDLRNEDWLMIEIALKLVKIQRCTADAARGGPPVAGKLLPLVAPDRPVVAA